jgi:YVTN family beta-propeller protein
VSEQSRPVPRDELAEALWEEAPPATWDKALTGIVSKLRALLAGVGINSANVLTGAFGCYRLELPEGSWVDVIVAANEAQAAEEALTANDLDTAKTAAGLAESLLRRPFLPGEDGPWVEEKRREFADVRGRALTTLADACLRAGDTADAAKWAEQTIALAPFRETGYRRLMGAHAAAGNRAEALRVYERCRLLLAEELGAYPSPETETIYRELLEKPSAHTGAQELPEPRPPPAAVAHGQVPGASRRRLALVLACVAFTATAAVTAAVALLTRSSPGSVAAAAVSADSIGIFRPGNGLPTGQIPVGAAPSSVAAGAGSIWVTNIDAHSVSRIDPAKQATIDTIPVGNAPAGIAFGGGRIWVTNGLDGTVDEISPQTDTVVDTIPVGIGPGGIAVSGDKVWVASSGDGTVMPIELKTGKPLPPIAVGQSADGVAVGFGSVWVTSEATGSVARIDPLSGSVVASRPATAPMPSRSAHKRSGSRTASTEPSHGSIPPATPSAPRSRSATARTASQSRRTLSGSATNAPAR